MADKYLNGLNAISGAPADADLLGIEDIDFPTECKKIAFSDFRSALLGGGDLGDLSNVDTDTPTSGNVLVGDGTKWDSATPDAAGLVAKSGNQTGIAGLKTFDDGINLGAGATFRLGTSATAGHILTADVSGFGTWQAVNISTASIKSLSDVYSSMSEDDLDLLYWDNGNSRWDCKTITDLNIAKTNVANTFGQKQTLTNGMKILPDTGIAGKYLMALDDYGDVEWHTPTGAGDVTLAGAQEFITNNKSFEPVNAWPKMSAGYGDPPGNEYLATKKYVDDNVGETSTLAGLTDTNISGPSIGDLLQWDGTDWVDRTADQAGVVAKSGSQASIAGTKYWTGEQNYALDLNAAKDICLTSTGESGYLRFYSKVSLLRAGGKTLISEADNAHFNAIRLGTVATNGHVLVTDGSGNGSWAALTAGQIPSLDTNKLTSGTLSVERGGTGSSAQTALRALVTSAGGLITSSIITSDELECLDAISNNIQTQLNGKAASSHAHAADDVTSGIFVDARIPNLAASKITSGLLPTARGGTGHGGQTPSRAVYTDPSGIICTSDATATELEYLMGVTNGVQTQLNGKAPTSHAHAASDITSGQLLNARLPDSIDVTTLHASGNVTASGNVSATTGYVKAQTYIKVGTKQVVGPRGAAVADVDIIHAAEVDETAASLSDCQAMRVQINYLLARVRAHALIET